MEKRILWWISFVSVILRLGTSQETEYIQYLPGDAGTRFVVAAPHAGWMTPPQIRNRPPGGCWDYDEERCVWEHDCGLIDTSRCGAVSGPGARDLWTMEQAPILRDELLSVTGYRPHVIINHLHRSKMDANRYIDEAAFGDPGAEAAWKDFQGYINASKASIGRMGIFIDLHGQVHHEQYVELGYTITSEDLDEDNVHPDGSSIRNIANYANSTTSFESILRGATSFGSCLEDRGYASLPSPLTPSPAGAAYFSGGYNTRTHGSRYEGVIDGIQIESPSYLRNRDLGPGYTADIAECLNRFIVRHYPVN